MEYPKYKGNNTGRQIVEARLNRILTVSEATRPRRDLNGRRVYTPEDIAKLQELVVGSVNTTEIV